jgi:hypothetical protein
MRRPSGVESFCGAFQQFPISEIYLDGEVALRDYAKGCALPIYGRRWALGVEAILHSTLEFRVWKSRIRLSRNCKERVCGSVHDLLIKLKRCLTRRLKKSQHERSFLKFHSVTDI